MNELLTINSPLQNIFLTKDSSLVKQILLIISGICILAIASQISIPFRPVPLTIQSTTVVLLAMAFGARTGAYIVIGYFMAGIAGLPIFADFTFGLSKFYGPTGGYLLGFLPAALLSGYLAEKGWANNIVTSFLAACLGTIVIFSCGLAMLSLLFGWENAVHFGIAPFIFSEVIKLTAVSILVPRMWNQRTIGI